MQMLTSCLTCFCILLLNIYDVFGQFHGDECTRRVDRTPGRCEYIDRCEQAKREFANGIRPQICSFIAKRPIVCCSITSNTTPINIPQSTPTRTGERISAQKCEEYKKLVTRQFTVGTLAVTSHDHVIQSHDCNIATSLIVGGERTKAGEFPHMAAIGWKLFNEVEFACGGSLISEKYVLTAAHCFRRRKQKPDIVRLGEQNLKTDNDGARPQDFGIIRLIRHEQYNPKKSYFDIGLIELDRTVRFNKFIRPACLWQPNLEEMKTATATGWGLLQFAGAGSDELQKVSLSVISNQQCNPYFDDIRVYDNSLSDGIVDGQVCAAAVQNNKLVGGQDTCNGDSGGPLQVTFNNNRCVYHLLGITSFSAVGCGAENSPGVYTRVSHYLDWIESKVW